MAVIKSITRYRATSEQQKLLQRNITAQAEAHRLQLAKDDLRKAQRRLQRLQKLNALVDPNVLTTTIADYIERVEMIIARASMDDLSGEWERFEV